MAARTVARAYRPIAANIDLLYIRYPQRYAVLILVAYVVAATLFAVTTPPWQNPDEPAHYNYIAHIAAGHGLPVLQFGDYDQSYIGRLVGAGFPDHLPVESLRYESYQPPLYYLAAAPIYMLGAGELLPLRLFNVVLGAASILLLFACLNVVFPTKPLITVGATAFAAFLPMHVAMSAAVNNDGLAELLLLAVFLMLLRWMKARFHRVERTQGRRPLLAVSEQQHLLGLGVLLGLGMLSKIYAYLALPLCLGTVLLVVWLQPQIEDENPVPLRPTRRSFAAGIIACLWISVPAILLVLPLWMRNVVLYGAWDVLGLRIHDAVVIGQPMTAAWIADKGWIEFLDRAVSFTFRSFWGVFGWMGVFMEPRIYALLMIFSGVLFSGLLWALVRFICGRPEADMDRFQFWVLGLFAVMSLVVLASYVGYNAKFVQHQGRYLFWGLLPISTFAALAWRELMQPLQGKVTGFLTAVLTISLAGANFMSDVQDKVTIVVIGLLAILLVVQPFLLTGAVDPIIVGAPSLLQRWFGRRYVRPLLPALRKLVWATPFLALLLLDFVIPFRYILPQVGF